MSTTAEASQGRMPRQIPYIIGNEACERFSFYGMRNILVPFLISSVLLAYLPEADRDGKAKDMDGEWGRFSVSRKEGTDGNEICVSFLLKD